MKFTVSSTALASSLQSISRVIASKSTMQILESFLFKIDGETLTLTASDMETTLTTTVEISNVSGKGAVAISSKLLLDIIKEFSDQPLQFEINDENMAVEMKSAAGKYTLVGQLGDEYPTTPTIADDAASFVIPVSTLLGGINKTSFAAAVDDLRPTMAGIFFDIKEDSLTFVATDAHKLVRLRTTGVKPELVSNFILPQKPASALKSILPKESGEVTVQFDGKNIVFTMSQYQMYCRQIEGRFPPYENVIPNREVNVNKLVVDRMSFLKALKRVSLFTNQANNLIKIGLLPNKVNISAQDIDYSISANEELACQYDGAELNIGFKSQFLMEILGNIDSTEVSIELSDPSRAGLILPYEQAEDEDLLMLLMPMLLND